MKAAHVSAFEEGRRSWQCDPDVLSLGRVRASLDEPTERKGIPILASVNPCWLSFFTFLHSRTTASEGMIHRWSYPSMLSRSSLCGPLLERSTIHCGWTNGRSTGCLRRRRQSGSESDCSQCAVGALTQPERHPLAEHRTVSSRQGEARDTRIHKSRSGPQDPGRVRPQRTRLDQEDRKRRGSRNISAMDSCGRRVRPVRPDSRTRSPASTSPCITPGPVPPGVPVETENAIARRTPPRLHAAVSVCLPKAEAAARPEQARHPNSAPRCQSEFAANNFCLARLCTLHTS